MTEQIIDDVAMVPTKTSANKEILEEIVGI